MCVSVQRSFMSGIKYLELFMKNIIFLLLTFSALTCAQPFTDIGAGLSATGYPSTSWGDYDNDGDLDILIAGSVSKIYRNDSGSFTDIGAGLRLPCTGNSRNHSRAG